MTNRLLAQGHRVCAFDRSQAAMDAVVKAGASAAASAEEVASAAATVFLSLPNPEIVHSVALGKAGIIDG
jgi:3-hydroxyisobutyrate dehydrogenase-like beta-hydroxyacid dehydrogenase